ncbi:hypothetical protein N7466_000492 [Penicillium verhagenii]|uniref:uncharacterized protein n=1 Tax=Penicillium verhagenii TaxID=1562060 RepID=UPI002544ECEF|nr:uncharacterized protein N7466_000492 [Penicillium verhagenii]KAJ5947477.1 hypothetical protein N7466_000492 [Penicillium verhagenii]
MSYTLYDGSIAQAKASVSAMIHLLDLAAKQPNADALLNASLHPDMKPLTFQVFLVEWLTGSMLAKLTGREAASVENNITTYAQANERLEALLKGLKEADKAVVNSHGDDVAPVKLGPVDLGEMTAAQHATNVVMPNVFFHVTTAYGILRKEGLPLGKSDYLAPFISASA